MLTNPHSSLLTSLRLNHLNVPINFIHTAIGVFTQHHLDSFDLRLSPLENMMLRWPLAAEADLRAHLGNVLTYLE